MVQFKKVNTELNTLIKSLKKMKNQEGTIVYLSPADAQQLMKFEFNRTHKKRNINNIKESIRENGFITEIRAIWSKVNGTQQLIIADGHGRLKAAVDLQIKLIPLIIVVRDDIKTNNDLIQFVSALQVGESWNIKDFFYSYAAAGEEEYVKYKNIFETYGPILGINSIAAFKDIFMNLNHIHNPKISSISYAVKNGMYKITSHIEGLNTLNYMASFVKHIKLSSRIITAVHKFRLNYQSQMEESDWDKFRDEFIKITKDIKKRNLKLDAWDSICLEAYETIK